MSKTSLYEKHLALNAKIVDFAGWQMPIQYKNLKEEVTAVRENVGVFDVSHMGEFFVTGKDAVPFVDYIVTNDIAGAQLGKAVYSPLCRENGTVIDDLIVYKIAEDYLMICVNAANIEKDYNWIESKSIDFEVQLVNKSQDYSLLAVQGPKTFEILKSLKSTSNIEDAEYYSVQKADNNEVPVIYARTGYTGEDGFEVFGPHDFINNVWDELIQAGVEPCGLGARDVLRLEVCYPLYGNELNDELTPLDSALKWTVKDSKEKFIGKQALADYKAQYRLVKLITDKGIPREGYKVLNEDDQEIGVVTSGTMSVCLKKGIALARVKKELFSEDSTLFIEIRNKKYPAQFTKKAFVSGGHK